VNLSELWLILWSPAPFAFGLIVSSILSHVWRKYRNRIISLRWETEYQAIALSGDHATWGKIEILYNDAPVHNIAFVTISIENDSSTDLADLGIDIWFSDGTTIQASSGNVLGSANLMDFTGRFSNWVDSFLSMDSETPEYQEYHDFLYSRRSYHVPVFNRGSNLNVTLLVQAPPGLTPLVNVSTDYPGVRLLHEKPQQRIFGVNLQKAILLGFIIGILAILYIPQYAVDSLHVSVIAFLIGSSSTLIGSGIIRIGRYILRWLR
jgi:hypothetical protein